MMSCCRRRGSGVIERWRRERARRCHSNLALLFGWGTAPSAVFEVRGIRDLTAAVLDAGRRLGATIKPIIWASRNKMTAEAFLGAPLSCPIGIRWRACRAP